MKIVLPILLIQLAFSVCRGQNSGKYNFENETAYLNNKDSAEVLGWGVGRIGISSKNIYLLEKLIYAERYDIIRLMLDSEVPSTKYLVVNILERANKKRKIVLSEKEKLKIKDLYNSEELIPVRSGCTMRDNNSISFLLNARKKYVISWHTKRWTKSLIK